MLPVSVFTLGSLGMCSLNCPAHVASGWPQQGHKDFQWVVDSAAGEPTGLPVRVCACTTVSACNISAQVRYYASMHARTHARTLVCWYVSACMLELKIACKCVSTYASALDMPHLRTTMCACVCLSLPLFCPVLPACLCLSLLAYLPPCLPALPAFLYQGAGCHCPRIHCVLYTTHT